MTENLELDAGPNLADLVTADNQAAAGSLKKNSDDLSMNLYAQSEQAMKQGHLESATDALEQLIERYPNSPNAELAHYDLALLAYRARHYAEAIRRLNAILSSPQQHSLRTPAKRLRCRALAASGDANHNANHNANGDAQANDCEQAGHRQR